MPIHRIVAVSRVLLQCNSSNFILKPKIQPINKCRFLTVDKPKQTKALKNEKEKVRMYIVQRYIDYVKNYMSALEVRFPTAVRMYRVFSIGIKDFLRDLKTYISLRIKITKDKGFSKMSRKDIELFQKMPSDMLRIAPVLVLSAIPFGNYVIFPLAFLRPKTLLCSHFWSIQQRVDFSRQDLTERLRNNKPVFRALQAKLDMIQDSGLKEKWSRILALLGSGVHPTPNDILECKDLFTKEPYQLNNLTYSHMGYLLKMHGLRKNLFRTNKLKYHAFLLLEMDKAIVREGGVEKLNMDTLCYACHIRGLHSSHLSNKHMREWLKQWLLVSVNVDKNSYSLILHCPIFLAYNHPQNWMLIY
ncbi:LETM1 domain-containing protein 1 [Pectinophora gossypiella]|uniref:Letm1 RBD domain-containing protein n=1 Tax=Pectinophora gossypiella TaxID=13191 RepID=A0A1E1WUS2_PECGO|nr:LETM1 domain-containing protein 1 [Pectinophora gossypiella]